MKEKHLYEDISVEDYYWMRDQLEKVYDMLHQLMREVKELKKENKEQKKLITTLRREGKENETLRALNKQLQNQVKTMEKIIESFEERCKELEEKVACAEALLHQNSDNSSKPTGTDQNTPRSEKKTKSVNEYNSRQDQKQKRKVGGQAGHPGSALKKDYISNLLEKENVVYEIKDIGNSALEYKRKFEVDLICEIKVTEIRLHADSAQYQLTPSNHVCYGNMIKAMSVLLNTDLNLSYHKIRGFLSALSQGAISPSTATVHKYCSEFAKKAGKQVSQLAREILNEPILGTDSTVMMVNGKRNYIRVFTAGDKTVYTALETKSLQEMKDKTILPVYSGILVHDHEVALYHFGEDHSECVAHELRYCQKTFEDTGNNWAEQMKKFFQELIHLRKERKRQGESAFRVEEIEKFHQTYHEIIALGRKQNKTTQFKFARDEEKTFLNRLEKFEHNILLFLEDFRIPPDNNESERKLRTGKSKQKVSTGFRTFEGLENYSNSLTVIRTAQSQDLDLFDFIQSYF